MIRRMLVLFPSVFVISVACSAPPTGNPTTDLGALPSGAPRAVKVARTSTLPACTSFVDAASTGTADGTAQNPRRTIAAAIAAADAGAVICVAEGTYGEKLTPGTKYFTLAGGFQRGKDFKVRDSAAYVSKAQGSGGSFLEIADPGPTTGQLTAVDGFEITGYSQAIVRDIYYSQRLDITNNYIHDNVCAQPALVGAGLSLNNVSGTIRGNVFAKNSCSRGGAVALNDSLNSNTVSFENNLVDGNSGTEPQSSHGGALYLLANSITLTGNELTGNTVTGWGAALYLGALYPTQQTTATLTWNVYRDNRAGIAGGGIFCDDAATCLSDHEIYDKNCGGNIYLDSGPGPTVASFDHLTNVSALAVGCGGPGAGVVITKEQMDATDSWSFTNAIFWGNAAGGDFDASCNITGCAPFVKVNVTYSMVQTNYVNGGVAITFGMGNRTPMDPLFVAPATGDFHLQSTFGHWTPTGYVHDAASSPALAAGDPAGSELGAYGNSVEASYVR